MKNYYYSAKSNGFYHVDLKADYESSASGWPADAVAISDEVYEVLFAGQSAGRVIAANNRGKPVLVDALRATPEQLIFDAKMTLASCLAKASETIAPLQDAVDIGEATDDEVTQLNAWKKYRVLLNRLDLSVGTNIVWPGEPANVA